MRHPKSTKSYETLRAWRLAHDLTQAQAAKLLGVSFVSYNKYERGVQAPRVEVLKRMIRVTGVPCDALVGAA